MKENPKFNMVCCEFHFVDKKDSLRSSLMFSNKTEVFILNLDSGDIQTMYKFKNPLNRQPANFDINEDQTVFVIASIDDGLFINTNTK